MALARQAMRTRFEIVIADDRDPVISRAAAEEALEEIGRVEDELSAFVPESALSRLNAAASRTRGRAAARGHAGRWSEALVVEAPFFQFLHCAADLTDRLDGAFDLTVGALLSELRRPGGTRAAVLRRAQATVGFRANIRLNAADQSVSFARPRVQLDPGAIGKGYALARASALLRQAGVVNALLHGGTSSVVGMGGQPGEQGWNVAVQAPGDAGRHLARVVLKNQSLGVSTIEGRVFGIGAGQRGQARGQVRGHVIDPRSGESVAHTALAAVVTTSAADADALSTALLVLGRKAMSTLAARFEGAGLLCATPLPGGRLRVDRVGTAFVRAGGKTPEG